MKIMRVFYIGAFSCLNICVTIAAAAVSQLPASLAIGLVANSTAPSLPANSFNLSTVFRFPVPESAMRIDFEHQLPAIPSEDILMCLLLGLSLAYDFAATEPLPQFLSQYYSASVYIEDLDPTPGKEYTYGNLTTTLRGIGLYITEYDRYKTDDNLLRIYDISIFMHASLVGTGWIVANRGPNASVISAEGFGAAVTDTPMSLFHRQNIMDDAELAPSE